RPRPASRRRDGAGGSRRRGCGRRGRRVRASPHRVRPVRWGMTPGMRVALMIEGQEDVTWGDWVALADACERSGIEALFRSDHYLSVMGEGQRGSLDAWATINALAAHTTTLRLGTMVSPT